MKNLVEEVKKILGPAKYSKPESQAIRLLAEEIDKLKVQQNSIDRRTSGLKLYGKIL